MTVCFAGGPLPVSGHELIRPRADTPLTVTWDVRPPGAPYAVESVPTRGTYTHTKRLWVLRGGTER